MTEPNDIRVLVTDDQTAVREGLVLLINELPGQTAVGHAGDGNVAVELVGELRPDVVLMDVRMPRCDGIEATRRIREQYPETQVIMLTTYADDTSIVRALNAGALGFLTKSADRHQVGRAVLAAAAGQAVLDNEVQRSLLEAATQAHRAQDAQRGHGLTTREQEVLQLVADGLVNRQIARRLFVSEATVKTHINHIFAKTNSRNRADAVRYAHGHGLLPS